MRLILDSHIARSYSFTGASYICTFASLLPKATAMGAHTLTLDSAVRDWVFIPLILAIALMKLLTQYAQQVTVVAPA